MYCTIQNCEKSGSANTGLLCRSLIIRFTCMGESVLDAFSCPCGMCFGVRLKCVLGSSVSCPPADPRAHVSLEKDAFLIRFRSVWGSVWGSVLAPAPAGFANGSPNGSETDRQTDRERHPCRGKRGFADPPQDGWGSVWGIRFGSVRRAGGSGAGWVGSQTHPKTDPKRIAEWIQNGSPNGSETHI